MPIVVYKHFNVLLLLLVVTCLLCGSVRGNKKKSHHLRQRGSRGVQEGNVYSSLHWQALKNNKRGIQKIEKEETYEYYTDDNIQGDGDGDDYDVESEQDESYDVSIAEMKNDDDDDDGEEEEEDEDEEVDEEQVDEEEEEEEEEDPVLDHDDDDDDEEQDHTETSSPTTHQNSQSSAPTPSPVKKKSKHKNKQEQEEQSDMSLSEYTDDGQISTITPTVSLSIVPLPTAPPNPATSIPTSSMDKSYYMHSRMPTVSPTNRNSMKSITTHAPTPLPTLVVEPMTEAPTVSLTSLKNIATNAPTAFPTREPTSNNIIMDDDYYTNDFNLEPTSSLPTTQMRSSDSVTTKEQDNNNNNGSGDDMMDKIYDVLTPEEIEYLNHHKFLDEEKEAAKISAVYFVVTLFLMIFTAHQLSENPDGVYSNMCRLAMTVTGCVLKIFLLPFRKICGFGTRQGYSHHLVVSNDPYNSGESISRMEMI